MGDDSALNITVNPIDEAENCQKVAMVAEVSDLQDAYEDSSDEDIMVEDDLYQDEMTLKRSPMKNVPAIIPELVLEVDEPDSNGTTIFRAYLNQRGFKFTRAGKK